MFGRNQEESRSSHPCGEEQGEGALPGRKVCKISRAEA